MPGQRAGGSGTSSATHWYDACPHSDTVTWPGEYIQVIQADIDSVINQPLVSPKSVSLQRGAVGMPALLKRTLLPTGAYATQHGVYADFNSSTVLMIRAVQLGDLRARRPR